MPKPSTRPLSTPPIPPPNPPPPTDSELYPGAISRCKWQGAGPFDEYNLPQHTYLPSHSRKKRVLVLCTGGTLTMAPDSTKNGGLAPVEGALTEWMSNMRELQQDEMPEIKVHEYSPLLDSSDMGPCDWACIAVDIEKNYLYFDGFVVLTGTDTMAYTASALSFMLENLGKPVIFTGSQIPLCEAYNDARRNLIMSLIFASRDSVNEVGVFFHDRLLRANRSTKINTDRLLAFDSPNMEPLANIGITIDENEHLFLPQPKGRLRVHSEMDTRLMTVRLVPGFDDSVIKYAVENPDSNMQALVLQLYGAGNMPSNKQSFIDVLHAARERDILVVATTQCLTGSVMLGHYAVGHQMKEAGVVSAYDMTVEATCCKLAYLFGRDDLTPYEVKRLMGVSLRGEMTTDASSSSSAPFTEKIAGMTFKNRSTRKV
ncbi:hypothetical protein TL16_g00300 [Triparma laevis f. inornata]|uniref:asparaginase n=1 Tax=Triparma laevis f. inornata TaxID=1714386 RepID=A0A9W6ZA89_9STRA|nr:hypothetical protein TL16_g00300 [Triparma laevis f. inornata]